MNPSHPTTLTCSRVMTRINKSKFFKIPMALPLAAAVAFAQLAGAASYTWDSVAGTSANTNWSTSTNWTLTTTGPNGPLAADTVVFGNLATVSSPSAINNYVDP